MALGDSSITEINKGTGGNPLRSRSTIICLACLCTLVIICMLSMKSGFYNVEFASMALLVLREMIAAALNHQAKAPEEPKK